MIPVGTKVEVRLKAGGGWFPSIFIGKLPRITDADDDLRIVRARGWHYAFYVVGLYCVVYLPECDVRIVKWLKGGINL